MRTLILMVLSLVLFFCDNRFNWFGSLRTQLLFITVPMQKVVALPVTLLGDFTNHITSKRYLLAENNRLKSELAQFKIKLQHLDFLERENLELRSTLNYVKRINSKMVPVELLALSSDSFGQKITISQGRKDGVEIGQAVVAEAGFVGQVFNVGADSSEILLITDKKSAIPAVVKRNNLQTIVIGIGDGKNLELANVSETVDVKVGDVLVTSDLGRHVPAGYLLGTIKEIKQVIGGRFVKVVVTPAVVFAKTSHVFLVEPQAVVTKQTKRKKL